MSRLSKFLAVTLVVVFLLACAISTPPLEDTQNLVETAQAMGTAIPVETLKALGTNIPDLENIFDPEGAPLQEWKGIPVMPQATAGQEFTANNTYSFKSNVTIKEVQDFYTERLPALGWEQPFNIPGEEDAGLMIFQKEGSTLAITITAWDEYTVIVLALQ